MINKKIDRCIYQGDNVTIRLQFGIRLIPLGMSLLFAIAGIRSGFDYNPIVVDIAIFLGFLSGFLLTRKLSYVDIDNNLIIFRFPFSRQFRISRSKILKIDIGTNELTFNDGATLIRKLYIEVEPDVISIAEIKQKSLIAEVNYYENGTVKSFIYSAYFSTIEVRKKSTNEPSISS